MRNPRIVFLSSLVAFALALAFSPQRALALPTFAQAYHIDCSACHTMVPMLNAYGRYVQTSAFGALDPDTMKKVLPVVIRESVSYRSTGKLQASVPGEKWTELNLSANVVGVLTKYLSYRLEQSFYSNNNGGGSTSHFWVAYNQLLAGDGHLVVGKFDMPAPPAMSYWADVSGFSSRSIGVGQHGYALSGSRWGVMLNYLPQNYKKQPYKVQAAYVGNSPPMYDSSLVWNMSNPYAPNQKGSDKAFQYKVAWARPDRPIEAGIYGSQGTYILNTGYLNPIDSYSVIGAYAQRDPVKLMPGLMAFYQVTNDSNVGPGAAKNLLVQGARSWAYAVEVDESLFNGLVWLGIRPVEYTSGLQASKSGYDVLGTATPHYGVFDIVWRNPKLSPYLFIGAESAVANASNATYGQPAWRVSIKWASPIAGP